MERSFISIDPSSNRYRFYNIQLQKNLFGHYYLLRHWGRIGQKGQTKVQIIESYDASVNIVNLIIRIRLSRGYEEINHN